MFRTSPIFVPGAQPQMRGFGRAGGGAALEFITGVSGGSQRNDLGFPVGMKFTVGASDLMLTHIGRWIVSGNSGTHDVKLWDGAGSLQGSVNIDTSAGTPDTFSYLPIGPITLSNGQDYFMMSYEDNGGDQWLSADSSISVSGDATIIGAYFFEPPFSSEGASGTACYVPVNFKYTL